MNWWAWVVAGVILLGAELTFVNAQFYLFFVGSAAIAVGLATAVLPDLTTSMQWGGFAALAIVSMVAFRKRIYERLRGHTPDLRTGPAGTMIALPIVLAPGESCQVEHGGTHWTARNEGDTSIPAGASARIVSVQGLTLLVRTDP
jgi:membrane protein implicated in regulation of membrane protease activity